MHAVHLVAYVVHGVYAAHITELHLWRWAPAGVVLVIARDQSEAITGTNALSAAHRAQPPSLHVGGVLLKYGEHVTFAEWQLILRFGHVVVNSSSETILTFRLWHGR